MGLLRHHDDRPVRRFEMREELIAIGDDSWITDESGQKAFHVDGKAMRVRDTWILQDATGAEVAEIKERKLTLRDKMHLEVRGRSATVTKRIIGLRDHFKIELDGQADLSAHGNVVDHEYEIEQDGTKVAEVSKRWFRVRESYGVEVFGETDPALVLAIAVAIDGMTRDR
ncbi:LURP-one-related/scramblase family protein [Dermatobacter hominis]|uniref:LURP-one-related/scramblase family protein n=1 Tax=Dermatobacter hominis TaxID=2884263 RepID=UPI001D0FA53C|nr:LURP-one-related family protein [Dermatobacter hominis]UDY34311.1 LURP-one-related family protein [Dermatobacter hominis]